MLVIDEKLPGAAFDGRLVSCFNEPGPYYSSYPSLNRWSVGMDSAAYGRALQEFFVADPTAPIYLYTHIPFCAKLCWYCICNIEISNNRERIQRFVDVLLREADHLANFFETNRIRPNVRGFTWAAARLRTSTTRNCANSSIGWPISRTSVRSMNSRWKSIPAPSGAKIFHTITPSESTAFRSGCKTSIRPSSRRSTVSSRSKWSAIFCRRRCASCSRA